MNSKVILFYKQIEMFDVNCSNIKLKKFDFNNIKNFAEDDIFKLITRLRKIIEIENMDKKDLLIFFKDLKTQLM